MAIAYSEMHASPTEAIDSDGIRTAQRKLLCAWAERWAFMEEILTGGGVAYEHDDAADFSARHCSSIPMPGEEKSETPAATKTTYEKAIVTVHYATPRIGDPSFEDEELYSEALEPSAEMMTLDHTMFRWGAANGDRLKEDEAPGFLLRSCDYVLTQYGVAAIPAAAMNLIGHTNNAPVIATSLGITFGTETLLYNPPTTQRSTTILGTAGWQLGYRLTFRPSEWNKFWRAATQAYAEMFVAGGARYRNYPLGDFSAL